MKWISVEEKPKFEDETVVLVLLKEYENAFWLPARYDQLLEKAWWIPQREAFVYDGVEDAKHMITHWMPLPQPPNK